VLLTKLTNTLAEHKKDMATNDAEIGNWHIIMKSGDELVDKGRQ
jgi:hypothetical protein